MALLLATSTHTCTLKAHAWAWRQTYGGRNDVFVISYVNRQDISQKRFCTRSQTRQDNVSYVRTNNVSNDKTFSFHCFFHGRRGGAFLKAAKRFCCCPCCGALWRDVVGGGGGVVHYRFCRHVRVLSSARGIDDTRTPACCS